MTLRSGFQFTVAPRFHDRSTWGERLAVNAGVERRGEAHFPRPDWHPVTATERRLLVAEAGDGSLSGDQVGLILIPNHLRRSWWDAAEQVDTLDGNMPGYQRFVTQLVEFLSFKRLPLPAQCSFDVVASRPQQSSTRVDPTSRELVGLAHSLGGLPPFGEHLRTLACINLGDEATHVVLCNLAPDGLRAVAPLDAPPATTADLARHFLRSCLDYPLVRVRLDPGDGVWLPDAGAIIDGWTIGKHEADVMLTLTSGP